MAKFKLVKIQTSVKNTINLLLKIEETDLYEQIIVDPQNPTEQTRIQSFKDNLEEFGTRLVDLSSFLKIPLDKLPALSKEEENLILEPNNVIENLNSFLNKYEDVVTVKYKKMEKLKKESRILSLLKLFQDKMEKENFSIELLSSTNSTFTIFGEIPGEYEELITFYLHELTADKALYWFSEAEETKKKAIIIISLDEYKDQIYELLKENYFEEIKLDFDVFKEIEKDHKTTKITELYTGLQKDISGIQKELDSLSKEIKSELLNKLTIITETNAIFTKEEKGRTDTKNFTIWGWVNSKKFDLFRNIIHNLDFTTTISVLEDVPLARKRERDIEQEAFIVKTFDVKEEKEITKQIPHPPHTEGGEGFLFAKKAMFVKLETEEKNTRGLISYVQALNNFQAVKVGSLDKESLDNLNKQRTELTEYQSRLSKLKNAFKPDEKDLEQREEFQIVDDYKHLKAFIENFFRKNEEKVLKLSEEIDKLRRKLDQTHLSLPYEEGLEEKGIDKVLLESGFQTVTHLGSVPKNHFKAVKFFLNEVTDGNLIFWDSETSDSTSNQKNILVITLNEYEGAVTRILNEYSFQKIDSDMITFDRKVPIKNVLKETEKALDDKNGELEKIKQDIIVKLLATEELISNELYRLSVVEDCQISEGITTLWGWTSKTTIRKIENDRENLPFKMKLSINPNVPFVNPAITKKGKVFGAVRGLVNGIGHPNPAEIDPYSIIRFTFPFLFGIMFADVGHGFLIALIAAYLVYNKKHKGIKPDESIMGYLYAGAELLLICGLSSMIFGFLFGSILGDEHFLPEIYHAHGINWLPLINPLEETKLFLIVALIIGFLMIQLGVLLKVYQNARYGHGIISWANPLSLSIAYIGIFAVLYNIVVGTGIKWETFGITLYQMPSWLTYLLAFIPVVFVLEYMHAKSDGIMDAIDHIIALVSNTLSFSRLMALLLVHAILSGLPFTFTDADLLAKFPTVAGSIQTLAHPHYISNVISLTQTGYISALGISWIWWIVGIIVALVLIIPLEGLLSFLNTLRLHWVEWFTKFYTGDGIEYKPITENLKFIKYITSNGG